MLLSKRSSQVGKGEVVSNLPAGRGTKLDIPTEVTMVSKVIGNMKCISSGSINQVHTTNR